MKNILLILLFILSSCTGGPRSIITSSDSDLEGTFNISDKTIKNLNSSKTQPKAQKEKASTSKQTKNKAVKATTKQSKKITSTKVNSVSNTKVKSASEYPEDYPPAFIEFDKKNEKLWKQFTPVIRKDEKLTLRVKFFGITVGDATIESKGIETLFDQDVIHYQVNIESASFYSSIYSLNDRLDSYISLETYTPVKYSLIQRETKQEVDDLQLFSRKELKTYFWYKRLKKKNNKVNKKDKEAYIPKYFLDTFSGFFFIRGIDLNRNTDITFPVVSRTEVSLTRLKVVGEEKIDIMGKEIDSWKVSAEIKLHDGLKKKGDMFFWYDKGNSRRILKFEAKVKIGSVTGELVNYSPGTVISTDK